MKYLLTRPRTITEVYELLPVGVPVELIDGSIVMEPAPDYGHQNLLAELLTRMRAWCRKNQLGDCVCSPVDVYLDGENVLQPDILFIQKSRLNIIVKGRVRGAPDLVIELLSPGNARRDRRIKKKIYERNGVREYYIINPRTGEAEAWYLSGKKFVCQALTKNEFYSAILNKKFVWGTE